MWKYQRKTEQKTILIFLNKNISVISVISVVKKKEVSHA